MYQIVAPILYDEPIVQNIGLFFLGVEQPITGQNETDGEVDLVSRPEADTETEIETEQSVPYHKRQLLDLVRKINIIRASSSTPLDKCYMEHPYRAYLDDGSQMDQMDCDRLARGEMEGWVLAERLLKRLGEQSDSKLLWQCPAPIISFQGLSALTLGLWDDGRWTTYEDRSKKRRIREVKGRHARWRNDGSDSSNSREDENGKSSTAYAICEDLLAAFFIRVLAHQAVNVCQHTQLGLNLFNRHSPMAMTLLCSVKGLRVVHGGQEPNSTLDDSSDDVTAGPTRIFTRYSQESGYASKQIHRYHMCSFEHSISAHIERHPDRRPDRFDITFRLEICVLPETEGADNMPDAA